MQSPNIIEGGRKKCRKGYARSQKTGRCHKSSSSRPSCPYGLVYDPERKICRFRRSSGRQVAGGPSPRSRLISPRKRFTPGRKSPYILKRSPGGTYKRYYVAYTPMARNYTIKAGETA